MQRQIVGTGIKLDVNNDWCKKCKLHQSVTHPQIFGRGNRASKFLVLGESPGKQEDDSGMPFVGKSGEFLQFHLNQKGIDCYISNAVRCRPKDGELNRTPLPTEIDCCYPFTVDLILSMRPKVILVLGKIALQQLVKINTSIEVIRGKVLFHPELETFIVPTYHPAYVLRTHDKLMVDRFSQDIEVAASIFRRPETRRIFSNPKTLADPIDIDDYLSEVMTKQAVAIDLETSGVNSRIDKITDISFCCDVGRGVHIKWSDIQEFLPKLKKILQLESIIKVFHNASFDISFLHSVGLEVKRPIFDTMLAYHTLTMSFEGGESKSLYKLKSMAWFLTPEGGYEDVLSEFGGIAGVQVKNLAKKKKDKPIIRQDSLFDGGMTSTGLINVEEQNKRLAELAAYVSDAKKVKLKNLGLTELQYYSAMDADVTYRIYRFLKVKIDSDYAFPYYNIVVPLSCELMKVNMVGIKIDIPYIERLIEENNAKADELRQKICKKAGKEFNLNSTEQMREFMYGTLGLAVNEKFVTGKKKQPSTGEDALLFYSEKKPILKSVLEYRNIQKQTSTFLSGYMELVDKDTHRVHPEYLQIGTATGRLSCTSPNLQQVPRDNKIRNMIIPDKDCKLIIADLSQIELRVLAYLSKDAAMLEAFNSGHDLHTYTACLMFNIAIESFDKENPEHNSKRTSAKTINFGMVYGQSARTLAESLGISIDQAESFMNRFFNSYPNVRKWISETKKFAKENGYVETLFGRRRHLPNVWSSDEKIREGALRQAVNTPIQSAAGDISFLGLIRIGQWLEENSKKSRIVGTVHDSILVESPLSEVEEVSNKLIECMTVDVPRIPMKLVADLDVLDRWEK